MQITTQRARPAWTAKTKPRKTQDCSRIAKEIAMMSGIFVKSRRQTLQCFILARDKKKKDQKNFQRKLVDYCPKEGHHKQRTEKHRDKQSGSNSLVTSKHVFPKGSAKMIDWTGKRAPRYNEFECNSLPKRKCVETYSRKRPLWFDSCIISDHLQWATTTFSHFGPSLTEGST